MALLLKGKGYRVVWPLLGGYEAWLSLGFPTQTFSAAKGLPNSVAAADSPVTKEQDNSWA